MIVTLVRATTDAVSLAEAKAHCRIDDDESDGPLRIFLDAAAEDIADWTGRVVQPMTLQYRADDWPCGGWPRLELPRCPVRNVTALTYFDESGVEQTVDPANWLWNQTSAGADVWFDRNYSFPILEDGRPAAVRVTFEAGYNDPANDDTGTDPDLHLPARVKQAILMLVGHWFENRETVTIAAQFSEVPMAARSLIEKLKVFR